MKIELTDEQVLRMARAIYALNRDADVEPGEVYGPSIQRKAGGSLHITSMGAWELKEKEPSIALIFGRYCEAQKNLTREFLLEVKMEMRRIADGLVE